MEKGTKNKSTKKGFPIVGIGASAGGMEAFGEFFQNMPPDSGMAFVVIQHLDPTHKGVMPELLQRMTPMKVAEVKEGVKVRPNSVYVIPPNKDISILHGILHLSDPVSPRGQRLPIDFFFRRLAEDQREKSAGIILSGMGTDGTMGIKAIKEAMGLAIAQDPASAKFDSMPRSAIDTGLVDYVAKAAELPAKLLAYVKHAAAAMPPKVPLEKKAKSALEKIIILLRSRTGQDFSLYKISTVQRRIDRRMGVHQIDNLPLYARFLEENPQEQELLFKELLIGVTSFFRDQAAFTALQEKAVPALLKNKRAGGAIRIWVPGCSTGEEAYSIAIVFREVLEGLKQKPHFKVQIFATDIDKDAIDKARQGLYPANISTDVSAERLARFFTKEEREYRIKKEIREMIVFAPHNVFMDPPFTKLDLLSCRNLLIYLMPELQRNLLLVFYYCLNPRGILFLGPSETIGGRSDLFQSLDLRWKLYARLESEGAIMQAADMPFPYPPLEAETSINGKEAKITAGSLQELTEKLLIQTYIPAAVLINSKGDILYIHGRTGNYLEPAAGKANMNIHAMAREGLRHELSTALHNAIATNKAITAKNVKVTVNGVEQFLDLAVKPLQDVAPPKELFLVVFQEIAAPAKARRGRRTEAETGNLQSERITELEKELFSAREQLQTSMEEMQTTQEELKSSNEELQSTNEELQSTNEELTTSKEELQSVNEELLSVNAELQTKIEDLTRLTNDMKNLLESAEIATLFLDNNLHIKRFTPQTGALIKLMPRDIGRPFTDIASNIDYDDLIDDVKEILLTLAFKETEARTSAGQWLRVRIMPYRTYENVIDGAVITFTDITALKESEASLRERERDLSHALAYARSIIATVREPFLVLDEKLRVVSANASFYRMFQVKPDETEGKLLYDLGGGQWNIPKLKQLLKEIVSKNKELHDFKVEHTFPAVGRKILLLNARKIEGADVGRQLILLAIEDRTG